MKLVVPKEIATGENRVGVTPDSVPSLKKMGLGGYKIVPKIVSSEGCKRMAWAYLRFWAAGKLAYESVGAENYFPKIEKCELFFWKREV